MNVYKYLRKREKLTQEELARKLHLNQTTVSRWEKEKSIPDIDTLINLANFYKCSIDYLVGRTFEQQKEPEQVEMRVKDNFTDKQKELLNIIKDMDNDDVNKIIGYAYSLNEQKLSTEEKIQKLLKEYKNLN